MNPPTYAGIGTRATPNAVLDNMTTIARGADSMLPG